MVSQGPFKTPSLVDVSDSFYFFLFGEGEWESEVPGGGGDRLLIENPRGGGVPGEGGAEGPGGYLQRTGECGGWAKHFFGAETSTKLENAFKNPSKTLQEGVEIDDALGFPASWGCEICSRVRGFCSRK